MRMQRVLSSPRKMPLSMSPPGLGLSLIGTLGLGSGLFPENDHLEFLRALE